jgi:hypothetical protein
MNPEYEKFYLDRWWWHQQKSLKKSKSVILFPHPKKKTC